LRIARTARNRQRTVQSFACDCINRPLSRRGVAKHRTRIADKPCLKRRRDVESRLRCALRRDDFSRQCKNLTRALSNLLKPLSLPTDPRLVSSPIFARATSCNLCHVKFANRVWIGRDRGTAGAGTCIGDPEPARGAIRTRKLAAPLAETEAMGVALNQSPSTTQQTGVEL